MSVRHHSIVQAEEAQYKEGAGDADSYNDRPSYSSDWYTPSSKHYSCGESSEGSFSQSEYEDDGNKTVKQISAHLPHKKQALKTSMPKIQNKREQHHLKQTHKANCKVPMFPPIKPREGPNQRIRSAHMHRIKELSSQVWELQQQLIGATTENRLLKQLQGRHTVALQHFQDSQSGLPQVLLKHSREVHALQELLRKARMRRNSLGRHLRATEDELLRTKDSLRHLQLLSQDQSLGEREKLSHRLVLVTADLQRKTRRMQDLEKNLELSHASFKRQFATEMRKTNEARELSKYLEEKICQLTEKIRDKEKDLENHNIYSQRFPKGWNKKGLKETKSVQTDTLSPLPIEAPACPLELEYPNIEIELERQNTLVNWESSANDHTDTEESVAENSEDDDGEQENYHQDGCPNKDNIPNKDACLALGEAPQDLEEEQTEPCDSPVNYTLGDFLKAEHLTNKALKSPSRTKRHYTFKETIQNLHSGKPAYSTHTLSLRRSPPRCVKSLARVENLGSGLYEPSFVTLPVGTGLRRGSRGSPYPEEVLVQSKKSSLMMELFGPGQDTGDASPISPGRETKIIFD